jgi:hypothetical protein
MYMYVYVHTYICIYIYKYIYIYIYIYKGAEQSRPSLIIGEINISVMYELLCLNRYTFLCVYIEIKKHLYNYLFDICMTLL